MKLFGPSTHWLIQRTTALLLLLILIFSPSLPQVLFLVTIVLFWHLYLGLEEILSDYVHHEVTRELSLLLLKIFSIILAKYALVFFLIH